MVSGNIARYSPGSSNYEALGGFGEGFGTGFNPYGPSVAGQLSDRQIEHVINTALDHDPGIPTDANINVQSRNGVVTLTGMVRNRRIKLQAGTDAWSAPGVSDVHNNIEIKSRKHQQPQPTPGQQSGTPMQSGNPSDKEIRNNVLDAIDHDPRIPQNAHVEAHVNHGVVTLTGSLPTKRAKKSAGDDAFELPSVSDVFNQIHVSGQGQQASQAQQPAGVAGH